MTRTELAALHVGSEVREYQTGIYADHKPVEKFGRPRRVVEVYHKGLSRKGRMYVNCFLAFGEDLRISATILEGDPTWQLAGHENEAAAKEFVKIRNMGGSIGRKMLTGEESA